MSEPALLAAIAAAPDDDLPRLVYADWLDENGRPLRAEFIRLQIEIARKETLPRAALNLFTHLWKRQQEILDDHRDELLGPFLAAWGEEIRPFEFRRGFLNELNCTAKDYEYIGVEVSKLTPLPEKIAVRHLGDGIVDFFDLDQRWLSLITHLQFSSSYHDISDVTSGGDAQLIRGACSWPRLQSLDMENCQYGDDGIAVLLAPPSFPALQELDLSFNDLTDAGVVALLATGVPQRLKRLVLGGNPIGDDGAVALAEALANSPVLENLNLRMTNVGQTGQAALLGALGGKVDLF